MRAFLLLLLLAVPGSAAALEIYMVTDLGNLIEIEPPLAAPKVANQPYIDRHVVGGLIAYTNSDYSVELLPPYVPVASSGTVMVIPNWAGGMGPLPLHGNGPPAGEIWVDEAGQRAFPGEMDVEPRVNTDPSTFRPLSALDVEHAAFGPNLDITVSGPDNHITMRGTGKAVIRMGDMGIANHLVVNYVCPSCGSETSAHVGTASTLLGSPVHGGRSMTSPLFTHVAQVPNFAANFAATPDTPLDIPSAPDDVSHGPQFSTPEIPGLIFTVEIRSTTNPACPLPADHGDVSVFMSHNNVTDILLITANNTDANCVMRDFSYDLYDSLVTLGRPMPLRPGYNIHDAAGGDPMLVVDVEGWARVQVFGMFVIHDNPDPDHCCHGFLTDLSVKRWTGSGTSNYGRSAAAVLHDAEAHYLAIPGDGAVPEANEILWSLQRMGMAIRPEARLAPLSVSHDPDTRGPTYNGLGSPAGGPWCDGVSAKYCLTLFKSAGDLAVDLVMGNDVLYDVRNSVKMIDGCGAGGIPQLRHFYCHPTGTWDTLAEAGHMKMADLYAVIPYSGGTVVHEVHVAGLPCDRDGDDMIEDFDIASHPVIVRLPYLEGDYGSGGNRGTTMDVPLLHLFPYLCINESNYQGGWRQIHMPTLPMDGGLGAVLGGMRATNIWSAVYESGGQRLYDYRDMDTTRLLGGSTVWSSGMVMPRDARTTAEVRYEIGMAMSGMALASDVGAGTPALWRDGDTEIEMRADLHIFIDGVEAPGSPILMVNYTGVKLADAVAGDGGTTGARDGNDYCAARFWFETPYKGGIITRSFDATAGSEIRFEVRATASLDGRDIFAEYKLCGQRWMTERLFTEVDVRRLTARIS